MKTVCPERPVGAIGLNGVSRKASVELWWLIEMIVLALGLGGRKSRFTRLDSVALIGAHFGFVAVLVTG